MGLTGRTPSRTPMIPLRSSTGTSAELNAIFKAPSAEEAIAAVEEALGGRKALSRELLASPELSDPIRKVLTVILDPRFDKSSLGRVCAQASITPGQFFAAFRDAKLAKANIHALTLVADRLVQIVGCLMDGAVDRKVQCPACDGKTIIVVGKGKTKKEKVCPTCKGAGLIVKAADFDKAKLALELGGLIKKNPLVNFTQTETHQTLIASGGGGALVQLQQAASSILYNGRQPLLTEDPPDVTDPEIIEVAAVGSEG